MRLIIGGYKQGKLDYLLSETGLPEILVEHGAECDLNGELHGKVLNHLHLLIRRLMEQGNDPEKAIEKIVDEHSDIILICDEIGCGIVPVEPFEREWREMTGRICCALAQRAERVDRVYCGIATTLK